MALIEGDWSEIFYDRRYLVKLAAAKKLHKLEHLLGGFTINFPIVSWSPKDSVQDQDETETAGKMKDELLSNCKNQLTVQGCWEGLARGDLKEGDIRLVKAGREFTSYWPQFLDFENQKVDVGVGGGTYLDVRHRTRAPIDNRFFDIAYIVDSQTSGVYHLAMRQVQVLFDEEDVGQGFLDKVFASYSNWQAIVLAVVQRTPISYSAQFFQYPPSELRTGLLVLSLWVRQPKYPDLKIPLPTPAWGQGKVEPTFMQYH